jgi:hypothetical protein
MHSDPRATPAKNIQQVCERTGKQGSLTEGEDS